MALSIKNPQTEEAARKLAQATGESLTEAVTVALEERLARLGQAPRRALEQQQVEELLQALWDLPDLDDRNAEEILGYDKHGLPA